ncbi:hypothetical protein Taro_044224 [Colocasia esculenta]|uniref:F-box/LRR-repeat protein 15-like leucin rich repeat domain-containing protein n=1 Tax=Colocasia esculenta TaxID=4460 RepID=A0A843WU06_COLES|nr:hypothetical protein [Colocasia esculenta]
MVRFMHPRGRHLKNGTFPCPGESPRRAIITCSKLRALMGDLFGWLSRFKSESGWASQRRKKNPAGGCGEGGGVGHRKRRRAEEGGEEESKRVKKPRRFAGGRTLGGAGYPRELLASAAADTSGFPIFDLFFRALVRRHRCGARSSGHIMAALINCGGGDDDVCHGGPLCSNLAESSFFLSLAPHAGDMYWPRLKKTRVSVPPSIVEDDQEQRCSMDALPDECLFEILRRVDGRRERSISACVSKRWLTLLSNICSSEFPASCRTKGVEKHLPDLNESAQDVEEQTAADQIAECPRRCLEGKEATDVRLAAIAVSTGSCGGLSELLVRGSNTVRQVTDVGLAAIARGSPSLRVLSMWGCPSISDEGLIQIASNCPLLEKLDLSKCSSISDRGIIAVANKCPNLSYLLIESCQKIGNKGLQAIGHCCPNLKSISIVDSALVGDLGVASLVSSASSSIQKIKLQRLNVTDASLAVVGLHGRTVTDLVISSLQNVTERGFWVMGFAGGLQKLNSLTITSCGVTDLSLEAVAKGCPHLKQACLRRCFYLSDAGLKAFAAAAGALESLQLEECNRITLNGLVAAVLNCSGKFRALTLTRCMGIRDVNSDSELVSSCLSLRSLSIRQCPGFGDSSLAMVGKICPQLQHIDLGGLVGVTDRGLLPVIEDSNLELVKVNLSGCINLTDASVSALARQHGGSLQVLNLEGCGKVTDVSLLTVAEYCMQLEDLDVSRSSVTDNGVAALATSMVLNLQVLSLSGCSKISTRSLPHLSNLGQSLVGLSLQQCSSISSHAMASLQNKMWWCDILS